MASHLVVDSGAFIRNAPIREIGETVYTIREVVSEIRDKATKRRLQVLPYQINFREPTPEAIRTVTEFSKLTGDYPSLSAVDIRVIALAYQLEKEHVGTDHIKTAPDQKITWNATRKHLENPTEIAGFYLSHSKGTHDDSGAGATSTEQENEGERPTAQSVDQPEKDKTRDDDKISTDLERVDITADDSSETSRKNAHTRDSEDVTSDASYESQTACEGSTNDKDTGYGTKLVSEEETAERTRTEGECAVQGGSGVIEGQSEAGVKESRRLPGEGDVIPGAALQEDDDEDSGDNEDDGDSGCVDDDDDDEGWITPGNISQVKRAMGGADQEKAEVVVGCLTTDFAMQNVLIQMGMNVVSVDGLLIKRAKSYVLRCFACLKITKDMTRAFCHHCGNKTLQKVSMTVTEDGTIQYFLSRRRPVSTRGLKYSLPKPQGGKHANNPILCEDQPGAQQRTSKKSKVKYDALDPDYVTFTSPFAPVDTHSRAAQLGIRDHKHGFRNKRNPNENRKVYGRRK